MSAERICILLKANWRLDAPQSYRDIKSWEMWWKAITAGCKWERASAFHGLLLLTEPANTVKPAAKTFAAIFTGYDVNGGYASYADAGGDFALPLRSELDDLNAAPLLCAGIIGFRALRVAGVVPGELVGLYGFGASAPWLCRFFATGIVRYTFSRVENRIKLWRDHLEPRGSAVRLKSLRPVYIGQSPSHPAVMS